MTGPTHVISGLATAAVIGSATGVTPTAVELLVLVVGTLAPDIDGRGSITKPGKILRPFLGFGIGRVIDGLFGIVAGLINMLCGHRGFTHAPVLSVAFFATGAMMGLDWLTWFAIGYTLHLIGDAMTAEGIPLFSPLSGEKTSLTSMRVKSVSEGVLAVALAAVTVFYGWPLLPEDVKATHRELYESVRSAGAAIE